MRLYYLSIIFLFSLSRIIAQIENNESINFVLSQLTKSQNNLNDTILLDKLIELSSKLIFNSPDSAIVLAERGRIISKNIKWKEGEAKFLSNLGYCYWIKGDFNKSLEYYKESLKISEEISDKYLQSKVIGNIGLIYFDQSNYPKALEYYFRALKIKEEIRDSNGIAMWLGNIGGVYFEQSNYSKALEYILKALEIDQKLGNLRGVARHLGNLASIHYFQQKYSLALEYYFKALKIDEEIGDKKAMASDLGNIGNVYAAKSNFSKALEYYFKALQLDRELGDKAGMAADFGNIGDLYREMGGFKNSEKYLKEAIEISKSLGLLSYIKNFEQMLSKLYESSGNCDLAFEHYKKYVEAKDTLESEERLKKQTDLETKFEYELKEIRAKAEREKRELEIKAERKRYQIIMYSLFTGLILVVISSVFIARSLYLTRKQKAIIERSKNIIEIQKKLVEDRNKEIMDSINYALRIQQAILPDESKWERLLPNSFKLYLPKDVLAGDFYWLEENENYIYVAAADSTGHGVPGAMVSVICSSALTKAVMEDRLIDTNQILQRVREIVIEKMVSKEGHLRDGMDVCLVRINKNNRREIQFSGANRPLIIIKSNGATEEINGDKEPIGWMEELGDFRTENKILNEGDIIYLTTDGFADQFGGVKGKKIKTKGMIELFQSVSKTSLDEQREKIHRYFEEWKGNGFQVDDVCIIGIRC
jgi:tetratricopeptide (TPR) repeat protein